jgi:hypothetical protein
MFAQETFEQLPDPYRIRKYCCLTDDEWLSLMALVSRRPDIHERLVETARVVSSYAFGRGKDTNAARFFCYCVTKSLLEQKRDVSEICVGRAILGDPEFDPSRDTQVRFIAASVRDRLESYYESDGKDDPIRIRFYRSYAAHFQEQRATVHVRSFDNWNPRNGQAHLCASLRDEIAYRLGGVSGLRVVRSETSPVAGPFFSVRGSFASCDRRMKVSFSMGDQKAGTIVCDGTYEKEDLSLLASEIVVTIISGLQSKMNIPLRLPPDATAG